ncbi:MAG: tetratricopeptide repeat protein [Spirosomataceae bacterium]
MTKNKSIFSLNNSKTGSIFVFLLLSISACTNTNKKEAAEFFKRANYHVSINETDRALGFYTEAIEKVPDFADAYLNRGLIYEKRGLYDKAREDYQKAVEVDTDFPQAKFSLARILHILQKSAESEKILTELPTSYQDSLNYLYLHAKNLASLNKLDQAQSNFSLALQKDPKNPEILTDLGFVYFLQDNLEEASTLFTKAIQYDTSNPYPFHNLSVVNALQKEFDAALQNSEKAIQLEPTSGLFHSNHGFNLLLNQRTAEAEIHLSKAEKLGEKDSYLLRNKGILFLQKKNSTKAVELLLQAEKEDPGTKLIYYFLGKAHTANSNQKDACLAFKQGKRLKDNWSDEWTNCP